MSEISTASTEGNEVVENLLVEQLVPMPRLESEAHDLGVAHPPIQEQITATPEQQQLLLKNLEWLRGYCIKQDLAYGEDVAQIVALKFLTKTADIEEPSIRGWLATVARNEIASQYRRKHTQDLSLHPEDFNIPAPEEYSPEDRLDASIRQEESKIVLAALQRVLTSEQRKLVKALYIDERPKHEVAEELKTRVNTLSARAHRLYQSALLHVAKGEVPQTDAVVALIKTGKERTERRRRARGIVD